MKASSRRGCVFANCRFLTWGFFGGPRYANAFLQRERYIENGTWVAGVLSDVAQLTSDIGSPVFATYQGHAIGAVERFGQVYQAVGSISLGFSFTSGSFSLTNVTIGNFDGMTLTGSGSTGPLINNAYGSGAGPGVQISGTHPAANVGTVNASLRGAFFGPGAPPASTAGRFGMLDANTQGGNYTVRGAYAAAGTSLTPISSP